MPAIANPHDPGTIRNKTRFFPFYYTQMATIYALIHGASLCWESAPPQHILGVVLEVIGTHAFSRASPCHGIVALALPKLGEAVLLGVAVPMLTSLPAPNSGLLWQAGPGLSCPAVRPGFSQLTREPELQYQGLQTAAHRG